MDDVENFLEVYAVIIVSKMNKGEYIDSLWSTKEEALEASAGMQAMLGEFFVVEIEAYPVKRIAPENYDA